QSISPLLYTELLLESGIAIDAIGLRLQFGDSGPGRSARDLMQLSDLLDVYAQFEKPVDLTAVGAPSGSEPSPSALAGGGRWRDPWSPELQMKWMTEALSIALGKPYVRSVAWHALFDGPTCDMPLGALIGSDGRGKPALRRLAEIRAAVRKRI